VGVIDAIPDEDERVPLKQRHTARQKLLSDNPD
jgi:hypothetical protein